MGRFLGLVVAIVLVAVGALMALPAVRTVATHQRADGVLVAAHAAAEGGGQARVQVVYRFVSGEREGVELHQLACRQADQNFHPIADPLLPRAEAERVVRAMLEGSRARTVYFRPEDPEATAFVLEEAHGRPGRRALTGASLAAVGLLWWLAMRRRRP